MKRLVGALLATGVLVLGSTAPGWAAPSPTGSANAMGYYLVLGDSLAAGYQPVGGADPTGGYADDVLAGIRESEPKTTLVNLACPGERSTTMVSGGTCTYDEGSQLNQALAFLHAHDRYTRVVTVQVGANDVQRCVDRAHAEDRHGLYCRQWPTSPRTFRRSWTSSPQGAPEARVVVLNYYNPFLAAWLLGNTALAQQSTVLQGTLSGIIDSAATASGATLADVAAFHSTDLTWSRCRARHRPDQRCLHLREHLDASRFDIHANDAGYALIGQTVVARLG